ncbi:hypothetical protein [Amycolatopsis sp. CA-128772]|uniref:hypothetical protein n=1 Tax=Amycolatopsis sp. CA-128772 TaxID=2073159 RepID=UPI000CD1593D|nr:hypothetical protein [Amycolatopsis sp. CA-128772]
MSDDRGGLIISAELFSELLVQFGRRGDGVRESGAFLLANADRPNGDATTSWTTVTAFALYDDLDPRSLTGGITFHAEGYSALGVICRRDRVRVVGDVHTHPYDWVGQSLTDSSHPMSALPGHTALIVPWFAKGDLRLDQVGVHTHLGGGRWRSYYGDEVAAVLRLTGHTLCRRMLRRLRHAAHLIRSAFTSRSP